MEHQKSQTEPLAGHLTTHFTFDGKWLADFARSRYHYENAPEHAMQVMRCLKGISVEDAYAVLNGDAQLGNDESGDLIILIHEPDEGFKTALKQHLEWKAGAAAREKQMMEDWEQDAIKIQTALDEEDHKKEEKRERQRAMLRVHNTLLKFADFAEIIGKQYGSVDYHDADMKRAIADKIHPSDPYTMTWKEFYEGKPWINTHLFKDTDTVEVVDFYCIPVRKAVINEYVNHVVDRLRNIRRKEILLYEKQDLWSVRELEDLRRELHGEILVEAGFQPMELTPEAKLFRTMIEIYLEQKARAFGVL